MTEPLQHPNRCMTRDEKITLEQLFDEKLNVIRERLKSMDAAIILARELLKDLMEGFPQQFVRKGDSDVAITELKSKMELIATTMSRIDLGEMIPRKEYSIQHQALEEKIGVAQKDIADKTELARKTIEEKTNVLKDSADSKFSALEKKLQDEVSMIKENYDGKLSKLDTKVQDGEIVRANIMGRILGTGATIFVALTLLQILLHYLWK